MRRVIDLNELPGQSVTARCLRPSDLDRSAVCGQPARYVAVRRDDGWISDVTYCAHCAGAIRLSDPAWKGWTWHPLATDNAETEDLEIYTRVLGAPTALADPAGPLTDPNAVVAAVSDVIAVTKAGSHAERAARSAYRAAMSAALRGIADDLPDDVIERIAAAVPSAPVDVRAIVQHRDADRIPELVSLLDQMAASHERWRAIAEAERRRAEDADATIKRLEAALEDATRRVDHTRVDLDRTRRERDELASRLEGTRTANVRNNNNSTGDDIMTTQPTPPVAAEHYTAWLTTDPTCLDQECADVSVLPDQYVETSDDEGMWMSTGDPIMHAYTTVRVAAEVTVDYEAAQREAEKLLEAAGWRPVGDWSDVPTGRVITVERAE